MGSTVTLRGTCQCGELVELDMPAKQFATAARTGSGKGEARDVWARCPDCRHPTLCDPGSSGGDHS